MTETTRTTLPSASVIVAVDGSEESLLAADWAAEHASLEHKRLLVVLVVDDAVLGAPTWAVTPAIPAPAGISPDRAQQVAKAAADRVRRHHPDLDVQPHVVHGDVGGALVRLSPDASMMVLGSRGRGALGSAVLGSVGARVARHAECPVVVCRPARSSADHEGVVVLFDGSADSVSLVERALEIGAERGESVSVVHCLAEGDLWAAGVTTLQDSIDPLRERFPGVRLEIELHTGEPESALSARRRPPELIVVGRHPVDSLGRHLGHVNATRVIEHVDSPVLVIPQERSVA